MKRGAYFYKVWTVKMTCPKNAAFADWCDPDDELVLDSRIRIRYYGPITDG